MAERPNGRKELRVRSHRTAQQISAFLAVVIAVSVVVWLWKAASWLDLCSDTGGVAGSCEQPPSWLRWALFVGALIGTALGAVMVAYLGRFARVGRIWRRSTTLVTMYAVAILVWAVLYLIAWRGV